MKHIAVLLGFLLLIAGCVYQQVDRFDANAVRQLQPGVFTEQDAIAQLEPPAAMNNNADGTKLLKWQYIYGTAAGTRLRIGKNDLPRPSWEPWPAGAHRKLAGIDDL